VTLNHPPLPDILPIFPLARVLLLPGGSLPLNIFEPRYMNMVADALDGDRLIGMVQPRLPEAASRAGSVDDDVAVYRTGCAGRIAECSESQDWRGSGRYLISLDGMIRFNVAEELPLEKGYRRVKPDFSPFLHDLEDTPGGGPFDALDAPEEFMACLKAFFTAQGIDPDWNEIGSWPLSQLVATVAMTFPFEAGEKQALLECPGMEERVGMLAALMEMAVLDQGGCDGANSAGPGSGPVRH